MAPASRMSRRARSNADSARRQRRSRRLATTIVVSSLLVVAVALGVWVGLRGISWGPGARVAAGALRIVAEPADAIIRFASKTATGTLLASDLAPGQYQVRVERPGYAPLERSIMIGNGQPSQFSYRLEPRRFTLALDVRPSSATWTIACSDGRTISGTGSASKTVPAGPTVVKIAAAGCAPRSRQLFVERSMKLAEWLDPSGQLVRRVTVFKSVPAPKGVSFTPDGKQIWVTALVTQPSIEAYDPRTGKVLGKVDLGKSGAVEVAFNKAGTRAYASQMQSASVFEIDTKTFKVLRQLKTGSSWTKIVVLSPDQKTLYAANWSGDDISQIDLRTGKLIRRMPTVDTPRGMWPTADGKRLFVAGFGEQSLVGRLAVIDLRTGKSRTFFERKGSAMRHMIADEKRGVLFGSDLGLDCLWSTNMKTLRTTRFVNTDRKPNTFDMSPDGRVLFVSCRGENNPKSYYIPGPEWGTVLLFDSRTGKPLDAIVGGNQCTALDVSDDGGMLVFSDFLDNRMRVYEVPPYDTLARGNGGLYLEHFKHVVKPGWPGWQGPKPN